MPEGDHNHNHLRGLAKPFQHRVMSCAKRTFALLTPIALSGVVMNANVPLAHFASCQIRRVRAKLL